MFSPAGPNDNYQAAGVSGISFHLFALSFDSEGIHLGVAKVTLPILYFEYPRRTDMFGIKNEIIPPAFAALVMARATDRAINLTDEWYEANKGMGDQWQIQAQFMKFLTQQVLGQAGRVTPAPNYSPIIIRPYSTL